MYQLTSVTKTYQKGRQAVAALAGVDLVIEDGEWLAIQGPTGHGKTTLLQMLGGLDRPTSGSVDFDGQDPAAARESRGPQVPAPAGLAGPPRGSRRGGAEHRGANGPRVGTLAVAAGGALARRPAGSQHSPGRHGQGGGQHAAARALQMGADGSRV